MTHEIKPIYYNVKKNREDVDTHDKIPHEDYRKLPKDKNVPKDRLNKKYHEKGHFPSHEWPTHSEDKKGPKV